MSVKNKIILDRPSDRELVFKRTFNAPRDLVWTMWTTPEKLAQWWGPNGFSITTHDTDVKTGGAWKFTMHGPDGRDYKNKIVYVDIKKPERLIYKHAGEEGHEHIKFQTTVTFDAVDDKTTLVTMAISFETAAELKYVIDNHGADQGGMQTLGRLADLLENPFFTITRTFDAPHELVFDAWTNPRLMAQWWGPKGFSSTIHKLELKPGGILLSCMKTPDGHEMWGKFVYRDVKKPERLIWMHSFSDKDGNITRHPLHMTWPLEMLTTVILEDVGGKTKLTLTWVPMNASEEEIKTFVDGMSGMNQGWTGTFDQMDAFFKMQASA